MTHRVAQDLLNAIADSLDPGALAHGWLPRREAEAAHRRLSLDASCGQLWADEARIADASASHAHS